MHPVSISHAASILPIPTQPSDPESQKAYLDQVRLLILGMEQRMKDREEKLAKAIDAAEAEGRRYEEAKKHTLAI